jgi:hypothetical protein
MWVPWQGVNYPARRLLLLGESCYSWRENGELIHPEPHHPVNLAEWAMAEPDTPIRFLRKLTRALCGVEAPSAEQTQIAWQSIAFTNYVPVAVGEGHAANPTVALWAQAASELPDVLNLLKPRLVIVLGREMWNRMPETQVILGDYVQGYTLENGETAMCHVIAHPSRGPSWTEYAAFIQAAEQA